MRLNKSSRVVFLLTLLALVVSISYPVVEASSGKTTFYFKEIKLEDLLEFQPVSVSPTRPTKQNDSKYPPSLFKKNTSELLPRYEPNVEEWLNWFTIAWLMYFMEDLENLTGILDDVFEGLEILLPHPFRVVEIYEYKGEEPVEINGDVVFDLYFSSDIPSKIHRDQVEVALYSLNMELLIPQLINNETVELTPETLGEIHRQRVKIEETRHTLKPQEALLFAVEIIPGNKTLSNVIKNYLDVEKTLNIVEQIANYLENYSQITGLQELGSALKNFLSVAEEFNLTAEDLADIIESLACSSFVYDSASHPSSVSIPARIHGEYETEEYFLHKNGIMNPDEPEEETPLKADLSETHTWKSPSLKDRNKIMKEASADLYFQYLKLIAPEKVKVEATLLDGTTTIGTAVRELDVSCFLSNEPVTFTFKDIKSYELFFGRNLTLRVSLTNDSSPGLRKVYLLYGSGDKPSSLRITFGETDNIQFSYKASPEDGLIIPGGRVEYTLNITSKLTDSISVEVSERENGDWRTKVVEEMPVDIAAGGEKAVHVIVESTDNTKAAYGHKINLVFIVSGRTGIARKSASAEVSTEAITYDVDIVEYTEGKYVRRGENGTFYFIIKNNNTGAVDDVDSYTITATSKNNWDVLHTDEIKDLRRGDKTGHEDIMVVVRVPKNTTLESDIITFTVTSKGNPKASASVNVTVYVVTPGVFEGIFEFFKSTSETLGFYDVFGPNAPYLLAALLVIIIIIFVIGIPVLLLMRKPVNIICDEPIKEVDSDGRAIYNITLHNPTKRTKTYEVYAREKPLSPKWEISLDTKKITVEPGLSKKIVVVAKATEYVDPHDWTEIKIKAYISGKRRHGEITLMAMMKDGKPLLRIGNVFSWPKEFKKGDIVTTYFKLENRGNIAARNVNVILYVNGREKNKVEVTIPTGGYADIRMPWVAYKGRNRLHIKAIEK